MRRVHTNSRISRAGTARDQAHAGLAGVFGVRLGHERRTAFLPTNHKTKIFTVRVEAVKHSEVAFAGHAKGGINAVRNQSVGDQLATGTGEQVRRCHSCKLT